MALTFKRKAHPAQGKSPTTKRKGPNPPGHRTTNRVPNFPPFSDPLPEGYYTVKVSMGFVRRHKTTTPSGTDSRKSKKPATGGSKVVVEEEHLCDPAKAQSGKDTVDEKEVKGITARKRSGPFGAVFNKCKSAMASAKEAFKTHTYVPGKAEYNKEKGWLKIKDD